MAMSDRLGTAGQSSDVSKMMANVGAVSANSGGSFFLTLLGYSETYLDRLQAADAYSTYADETGKGYFAAVIEHMTSESDGTSFIEAFSRAETPDDVMALIAEAPDADGSQLWQVLIDGEVYLKGNTGAWRGLYDEIQDKTLNGKGDRNTWADAIPLLFTSSLLTQLPALSQVKDTVLKPKANALVMDYPNVGNPPTAAPMIFAGLGSSTSLKEPPLLPGGANLPATYVVYTFSNETDANFTPAQSQAAFPVTHVGAVSAAAAGGVVDIPLMVPKFATTQEAVDFCLDAKDLAPAYTVSSPMAAVADADVPRTTAALAAQQIVRLADGGFTDNTSATSMMTFLATNELLDNDFDLVIFDDTPVGFLYSTSAPGGDKLFEFYTGGPVASLFGFKQKWDTTSDKYSHLICTSAKSCRLGVLPHIFSNGTDADPVYYRTDSNGDLEPVEPAERLTTTSPQTKEYNFCGVEVDYIQYAVTTIENSLFNMPAGKKGTLHVFLARANSPKAGHVELGIYPCYQPMVDWIHTQVLSEGSASDPTIGYWFQKALGL